MAGSEDLGRKVAELELQIQILQRASQAQHSTVETASGTVGLGDAVTTAVDTAAALPAVEESAASAQETADSIAVMTDGWDDELNTHLEDLAAELDDARADLEDSQADIDAAFGATVDGLSDDVETAITAAGNATTEAQVAADAARAAAGLAGTKGETIVQATAPTGSRANTANLWIDAANIPHVYGMTGVVDDATNRIILPAGTATEVEVMRTNVVPGVATPVALTLSASMNLPGIYKGAVARLRDGATGTELASYTFSDLGDTVDGNAETWTLPAAFLATPTSSVLVVTIQATTPSPPEVWSLHHNLSARNWFAVTDSTATNAAATAASAATAAQAAKEVADQANAAAGVAKTAADNANTAALQAAGIANGKGKVIYQASKPTGTNAAAGNLWIRTSDNTPWTYDTSASDWVQVTDKTATDAAATASAANQAAVAASNAAAAAQATADSKPLILFSSTAGPSGTAPTGTIWFLWDSAKNVAGQWLQEGTLAAPVWTPQQIRSEVIANLDVAKLTAGSAAIADLVARKIAASTANFQAANVSNLFVTSGATMSQAVIDFLFANVVQAKKIVAGMIDAGSLTADSFTVKGISASQYFLIHPVQGDVDYDRYPQTNVGPASIAFNVNRYLGSGSYDSDPTHRHYAQWVLDSYNGRTWIAASPYVNGDGDPSYMLSIGGLDPQNERRWGVLTQDGIWADTLRVRGNAHADLMVVRPGTLIYPGPYGLGMSSTTNDPSPKMIIDTSYDSTAGGQQRAKINTFGGPITAGVVTATDFRTADGTSIIADTGWIALTAASGLTATNFAYRIARGQVEITGSIKINSGQFPNGYTTLGTMPAGARPQNYSRIPIGMFNGYVALLIINTNGAMQIGASSDRTADTVYLGGATYPADR